MYNVTLLKYMFLIHVENAVVWYYLKVLQSVEILSNLTDIYFSGVVNLNC